MLVKYITLLLLDKKITAGDRSRFGRALKVTFSVVQEPSPMVELQVCYGMQMTTLSSITGS